LYAQAATRVLERRLVIAAGRGDETARARLVEQFMPAIAGVARRYRSQPAVDRAELIQEGVVGLLRALERYDLERGTPFWAYASWWVRQAMQDLIAELTHPVVLSDRALRQLARVKEARGRFLQAQGREPTLRDLAGATELPRERIQSLFAADRTPRGLAEPVSGDDDGAAMVVDFIADPRAEDDQQRLLRRLEIEEMHISPDTLCRRELAILRARFGIGCAEHTLQEIASRLELSAERVRQIEQRALEKLREAAEPDGDGAVTPDRQPRQARGDSRTPPHERPRRSRAPRRAPPQRSQASSPSTPT
jgi:RNA polymerase sigma factor (sigma-70 family)